MPTQPEPTPDGAGPFEYRFAPVTASIRLARHVLANWLELLPGVDVDAIDDLLVVCSELVTNAVVHTPEGVEATIRLRAEVEGDSVVLEVEDEGGGFTWPVAHEMRDVLEDEEHGRGLFIVEALTDRLGVLKTTPDRTVVRCVKHGVLRQVPTSVQPDLSARFRAEGQRTH